MGLSELIHNGTRLNHHSKKIRYRCPFCSKRFRSVPQRTVLSPYPVCPRCGVPVSEEHRIPSFDRTRKVLKVLFYPTVLLVKLLVLSAVGAGTGVRGISRGLLFLLMLPLTLVKELRRRRFADPETLEKYLQEVKGQWKKPGTPTVGEEIAIVAKYIKKDKTATQAKTTRVSFTEEDLRDADEVDEDDYEEDYVDCEEEEEEIPPAKREYKRVTLNDPTLFPTEFNPKGLKGEVVNCTENLVGEREWFIKWPTGRTGGPYLDRQIKFLEETD